MLAQITHYSTSTEVWIALSTAFASQSRAKTIQVHSQLSTLWKGSQTISDYFMTIKCLTDKLDITGQPFMCDVCDDTSRIYLLLLVQSMTLLFPWSLTMVPFSPWKSLILCY